MPVGAIAAIGGGLLQANAAKKAANAQTAAAGQDIAFQRETRDQIRSDLSPFLKAGTIGNQAYLSELGLGKAPAGYGGYTKTPGYGFRMKEGVNALEAGAAARGGLYSGAAMRDLNKWGQDYSSSEYDKYLSRIGALTDMGMSAAQMSGNASQNAAAGVSNALGGIGNAQAAGAIGRANAFSSGINDAMGVWNYQRQNPNSMGNNWLFGGKGLGI